MLDLNVFSPSNGTDITDTYIEGPLSTGQRNA